MMTSLQAVCFALLTAAGVSAQSHRFDCPPTSSSGPVSRIIPTSAVVEAASSLAGGISTAITSQPGDLCTLTLQDISDSESSPTDPASSIVHVPIARSYDGNDWEATAGPLSTTLHSSLVCSEDKVCTFVGLSAPESETESYVLTSYAHSDHEPETEAARFLEQATFGPTRSSIDDLVKAPDDGENKYKMWVKNQIENIPLSSHREQFRRYANPRYEYPNQQATAGPETACHRTSHWRKFTMSERDGLKSNQSKTSKYLSIRKKNGRFVWFIEGKAITTTSYLPDFVSEKGIFKEKFELEPTLYMIGFGNNERYSCIGCLIGVQKRIDDTKTNGFVKNPEIDLTGILGTDLLPYTIVDLPPILGSGNDGMVSIEDGSEFVSSPYFSQFNKPNDEFRLDNADTVDQSQCDDHPAVMTAAYDVKSELNNGGNIHDNKHPATVFPPIFGRSLNKKTGKYEHLLFDPHLVLLSNTIENPLPDGGGRVQYESKTNTYCSNAPRTFANEDHCRISFSEYACAGERWNGKEQKTLPNPEKKGVVICGSAGEIANDYTLGTKNGFDIQSTTGKKFNQDIYLPTKFLQQKHTIWANHALYDEGQLRQRVAWALYQIIPIGVPLTSSIQQTELWLQYYDIFVRNAFGSYFDVLKQIAYDDLMSDWLSFTNNKSLQQNIDEFDTVTHPDENFAREIMQLFSIGLFQLNLDGSKKVDENGQPLLAYDSSDIMNMAKAWTGFTRENVHERGNAEGRTWGPHLGPLIIKREWRDAYPKADLVGGYIGDGYPLCADLPQKHHLKKGAAYRVLGSKSTPELQYDHKNWDDKPNLLRLKLENSSPLFPKLCAADDTGSCTFPGRIVLDEHLDYTSESAQILEEFLVDTIRTIRIEDGTRIIYYEYVRQPCVEKAFLGSKAVKVFKGNLGRTLEVPESMCADPKLQIAAEQCCDPGNWSYGHRYCFYHAERVSYATAIDRCAANGKEQCTPQRRAGGICNDSPQYWASWSTDSCMTRVKISYESGLIGRVDYPDADYAGKRNVPGNVADITKNFFKVAWVGAEPVLPTDSESCNKISSCYSTDDGCVCDTSLTETEVYSHAGDIRSKDNLLSNLHVGAFDPVFFDDGDVISLGDCGIGDGIEVYSLSSDESCSKFGPDTFFGVVNENSTLKYLKNLKSTVTIDGMDASFRNVVHFISLIDPDLRDMYYEVDAVIEHLFHHPSHAPFLSIRMIQRFGISNPSPGFIERVAKSYINGSYDGIGSSEYGDLSAMVAAILLDEESRSVTLDTDPSHGHLREPLLKVTSLFRSMEAQFTSPFGWTKLYNLGIGQDSYGAPSVFSFFLPEYQSPGAIERASLVSPESQVLTGSQVTVLLDGLFSTIKFGLVSCHNAFGDTVNMGGCPTEEGDFSSAVGTFGYSFPNGASLDEDLDDLALMLTSGRLGKKNRDIIEGAIKNEYYHGDQAKATRIAQQLILASPEFHSWGNLSRNTGVSRVIKGYEHPSQRPYKNIVFFMMGGGVDSYNLLVPEGNCHGKDMYAEYRRARQSAALDKDELLDIDATGSGQICNTWGINQHFPILQELFENEEAMAFLNMGILPKPLTKHDDWRKESKIQLFAHNHMTREQMALDPHDINPGTGVGGRLLDMLKKNGYQTSGNTVDGSALLNIGDTYYSNPVSTIASKGVSLIDKYSSLGPNQMLNLVKQLNGVGKSGNSLLGETWSDRVAKTLFEYETALEIDEAIKRGDFNMDGYKQDKGVNMKFRKVAEYMKSRHMRKVDREIFYLQQSNYDFHGSKNEINELFQEANIALSRFIEELKRQDIWNDTVILLSSEFGRSVEPNSNGGTDHAWGGHYFMVGGGIDGGKLMGEYPKYLSDKSDYWVMRGRMIPTTPWDALWNGLAQWMGVQGDNDLDFVLPSRPRFDKCEHLFAAHQLFADYPQSPCIDDADGDGVPDDIDQCPGTSYWVDAEVDDVGCQAPTTPPPTRAPTPNPTSTPTKESGEEHIYEAEDNKWSSDSKSNSKYSGYTGTGYVDMGGKSSWVEWTSVDGGSGGPCILNFRYAVTESKVPRRSKVTINGNEAGYLTLNRTGDSWKDYGHETLVANCAPGTNVIRLTAVTSNGGPNMDNLAVSSATVPTAPPAPTASPTPSPSRAPVTKGPTVSPTASPTSPPTSGDASGQTYEAEDPNNSLGDSVVSSSGDDHTGSGFVNMGGDNSWIEWPAVDGGTGGSCTLNFRYAVKGAKSPRTCKVRINDNVVGSIDFTTTGESWSHYEHKTLVTTCPPGANKIRLTATTSYGGPNVDNLKVITSTVSSQPTTSPTVPPTTSPTEATAEPTTASPTVPPTTSPTEATAEPTASPTASPTTSPTKAPVGSPSTDPTEVHSVIANASITVKGENKCDGAVDGTTTMCSISRRQFDPKDLAGFVANPVSNKSIVKKLRVYTNRNCRECDPKTYKIEGRNSIIEGWQLIAEGTINLTNRRNKHEKIAIGSTFENGDSSRNYNEVVFENNVEYSEYQITFPKTYSNGSNDVSFAEVELPGYIFE